MPVPFGDVIMTMPTAAPRRPNAAPTKAFLHYLGQHLELRHRIRAAPNCAIAYVGDFSDGAAWKRLLRRQLSDPRENDFQMLPDVLKKILCPPDLYAEVGLITPPAVRTLLDYAQFLTGAGDYPAQIPVEDGFIIWRALSGIFMSNAMGRVRLMVGEAPTPGTKVFFRTEVFVLDRNPKIDVFARGAVQRIRAQMKMGGLKGTVELM
jgi:hypothetical protein